MRGIVTQSMRPEGGDAVKSFVNSVLTRKSLTSWTTRQSWELPELRLWEAQHATPVTFMGSGLTSVFSPPAGAPVREFVPIVITGAQDSRPGGPPKLAPAARYEMRWTQEGMA
jgi:hypothetical protein